MISISVNFRNSLIIFIQYSLNLKEVPTSEDSLVEISKVNSVFCPNVVGTQWVLSEHNFFMVFVVVFLYLDGLFIG